MKNERVIKEDWRCGVCPAVTMEVRMVKVLLHRLLKVPFHDLRLTYVSSKVSDGCCCRGNPCVSNILGTPPTGWCRAVCLQVSGPEFHLDKDMKTLHFYSVEDGDQILVRWAWPLTPDPCLTQNYLDSSRIKRSWDPCQRLSVFRTRTSSFKNIFTEIRIEKEKTTNVFIILKVKCDFLKRKQDVYKMKMVKIHQSNGEFRQIKVNA